MQCYDAPQVGYETLPESRLFCVETILFAKILFFIHTTENFINFVLSKTNIKTLDIMKKSVVSSFDVDHRTLDAGLYLRSVYTINDELAVRSWDLRFRAPMAHAPLGSGEVHTIEHLMAYYLRLDEKIGASIVSFCPMGCKTGFYLSTMNNVEAEDVRKALAKVYKEVFPLKSASDIVGLNEIQCGNPGLYAIDTTNAAMAEYMRTLFTAEEAEAEGIGDVYKRWW